MKALVALLVMLSPALAWTHENHPPVSDIINKSPVSLATMVALEEFHDTNLGSVWGWDSQQVGDEAASRILYVDAVQAVSVAKYDCHFHSHGSENEAHCHAEGSESVALTSPSTLVFSKDQLLVALASAMDIFNRKVSTVENITQIKTWQNGELIYFNLNYQTGTTGGASYYMCHIHQGADIDCHRSLNPGPQEPAF